MAILATMQRREVRKQERKALKIELKRRKYRLCYVSILLIFARADMKDGEKIILDGKAVTVYLCDQKDKCNKSIYCGKECKFTFEKERQKIKKECL